MAYAGSHVHEEGLKCSEIAQSHILKQSCARITDGDDASAARQRAQLTLVARVGAGAAPVLFRYDA